MDKRILNVRIDNARIIWRSFGAPDKYGKKGFNVIIEDADLAKQMKDDGWNVKELQPKEEGDPVVWRIPVETRWDKKPPKIRVYKSHDNEEDYVVLNEDTVECLDYSDIERIDLELSPSVWDDHGVDAVKAYLGKMKVWLAEDDFF